ncbi:fumarate reductase [Paludibacterium yongneupense]|uniref:fumarate reductase n=1 Tax=Paludibacterium yongneupense TaxID=400061 RepID=UPI000404B2CB|nr:fumarate reductase [Paludibacterium yongneupense]
MNKRRPYVRPMEGWWRKNPYFIEYMVHEGTALFVAAYALVLLIGVVRLAQGEAAWKAWLTALQSPLSVFAHLILLLAIGYHSYTWFKIMPRTLPPLSLGGKRVPGGAITATGLIAVALASLALLALAWRIST